MHKRNYPSKKWTKRTKSKKHPNGLPRLNINLYHITWKGVVDVNDRVLRDIMIVMGGKGDGYPR